MPLDRSTLAELFMERIYDVLQHNEIVENSTDLNTFKDIIRQDVLIQLSIIEEELIEKD